MAEQLAELNKGDLEVYSTTEKQVGIWIDGKPIYRRTFYAPTIQVRTSHHLESGTAATQIIDYMLDFTRGSGTYGNLKCFYGSASDYFASICAVQGSPKSLDIYIDSTWASLGDYYITVDYLKS